MFILVPILVGPAGLFLVDPRPCFGPRAVGPHDCWPPGLLSTTGRSVEVIFLWGNSLWVVLVRTILYMFSYRFKYKKTRFLIVSKPGVWRISVGGLKQAIHFLLHLSLLPCFALLLLLHLIVHSVTDFINLSCHLNRLNVLVAVRRNQRLGPSAEDFQLLTDHAESHTGTALAVFPELLQRDQGSGSTNSSFL